MFQLKTRSFLYVTDIAFVSLLIEVFDTPPVSLALVSSFILAVDFAKVFLEAFAKGIVFRVRLVY